jgi:hypothetical protein
VSRKNRDGFNVSPTLQRFGLKRKAPSRRNRRTKGLIQTEVGKLSIKTRPNCKAGFILESDNDETFRSAFHRAAKQLLETGRIGKWDLWVWIVR